MAGGEICANRNFFAPSRQKLLGGGGKIWTVNSKHLASWISGINIKYFKGTHTIQLPCVYYSLSFLQTELAEKSIVSEKSTFYYTVILVIISI